jgi:hypothetical protein
MDSHPMVARAGGLCGLGRRRGPPGMPADRTIQPTMPAGGVPFQRGACVQLDRPARGVRSSGKLRRSNESMRQDSRCQTQVGNL